MNVYNNIDFFLAYVKNCFKFETNAKESLKSINIIRLEVMKFSRFLLALGFIGLLATSCSHHTSCPAYSSNDGVDSQPEVETNLQEENV